MAYHRSRTRSRPRAHSRGVRRRGATSKSGSGNTLKYGLAAAVGLGALYLLMRPASAATNPNQLPNQNPNQLPDNKGGGLRRGGSAPAGAKMLGTVVFYVPPALIADRAQVTWYSADGQSADVPDTLQKPALLWVSADGSQGAFRFTGPDFMIPGPNLQHPDVGARPAGAQNGAIYFFTTTEPNYGG